MANLQIKGLAELNRKLQKISRDIRPELEKTTQKAVLYVHEQVPEYPPEPPESTYERTGQLGRQITTDVKTIGNEVAGTIGTVTEYAPYVISDTKLPDGRGPQAKIHKDRWWTLQGVVRKCRPRVIRLYSDMVKKLLGENDGI